MVGFSYCLLVAMLVGCAQLKQITQPVVEVIIPPQVVPLPAYSGPKARLSVPDFEVNPAKVTAEIGSDLRRMFLTALLKSNRFIMAESGTLGLDLTVMVKLADFQPQTLGGRAGVGGGGGSSGALDSLLGQGISKAYLALDIRIIDNSTSKVLATRRIEGQTTDIVGGTLAGFGNDWNLAGNLSTYANTPMEKAIRICIIEAVRYTAQTIPANYYKY